jgi:L-fuconolactonase
MKKNDEWLKLNNEEVIEPDLPICDSHHHFWDYPDRIPERQIPPHHRNERNYMLDQFMRDLSGGHNIKRTVFVECGAMYSKNSNPEMRCVGETEVVNGIAAQSACGLYGDTVVAAGIVGFADLTLGSAVEYVLEAHIDASPKRFRGIRYCSAWDPNIPNIEIESLPKINKVFYDKKFRDGFACLGKHNLSFDSWLYHTQLPELIDLAKAFPDTTIILDHIGTIIGISPYAHHRVEAIQQWQKGISALSECPNVLIKLGGLGMPVMGFGWNERAKLPGSTELAVTIAPYLNFCIEKFGTNRCMFESNFPADKVSYSYTAIWNAFKLFTKSYSPNDRAALFYETAARVYRLN